MLVAEGIAIYQLLMKTLQDDFGFECDIAPNYKTKICRLELFNLSNNIRSKINNGNDFLFAIICELCKTYFLLYNIIRLTDSHFCNENLNFIKIKKRIQTNSLKNDALH